MAESKQHIIKNLYDVNYLLNNNRVFIPSKNINIFPCSRRGSINTITEKGNGKTCYDPEARLNTERTNRIRTAINGFTDSFIINDNVIASNTLEFVLKGYRIEVKNFEASHIAEALDITGGTIYAHLSLHDSISLNVPDYYTEILYRQSDSALDKNYLDVSYAYNSYSDDFFVGMSFTSNEYANDTGVTPYFLPLFSKTGDNDWELIQTSLLPKVEHDVTPDSIKLSGDFTVKHGDQESFKVTKDATLLGPTAMSKLIVGELTEGDEFDSVNSGTIKVKGHIETPGLEVTDNGNGQANIDTATIKELHVDGSATLNNGLTVTYGATSLKKLDAGSTSVENLTVATDKFIVTSTGAEFKVPVTTDISVTAPAIYVKTIENTIDNEEVNINDNLKVKGNLSVNNVTVTNGNSINTPTLSVDTITSESETILVKKALTAESTIDVKALKNTQDDTGVKIDDKLTVTNQTTLNAGLTVASGDTTLKKLSADTLEVTNYNNVEYGLKVANGKTSLSALEATELKVATDALTVTKDTAKFTKPVTVENSLTANSIQINGQGQVPALELVKLTASNTYQLRFKFGADFQISEE
jgi:hypothetical protein